VPALLSPDADLRTHDTRARLSRDLLWLHALPLWLGGSARSRALHARAFRLSNKMSKRPIPSQLRRSMTQPKPRRRARADRHWRLGRVPEDRLHPSCALVNQWLVAALQHIASNVCRACAGHRPVPRDFLKVLVRPVRLGTGNLGPGGEPPRAQYLLLQSFKESATRFCDAPVNRADCRSRISRVAERLERCPAVGADGVRRVWRTDALGSRGSADDQRA
jgi:hypothetical protein